MYALVMTIDHCYWEYDCKHYCARQAEKEVLESHSQIFYTSLASIVVQIPVSILLVDLPTLEHSLSFKLFAAFLLNGVFFHFQSITAYVLMDYISPVTHRYVMVF